VLKLLLEIPAVSIPGGGSHSALNGSLPNVGIQECVFSIENENTLVMTAMRGKRPLFLSRSER
jgi:hypothetical protein